MIELAPRLAAQARVDTRQGAQSRKRDRLSTQRTASIVTSLEPVQGGEEPPRTRRQPLGSQTAALSLLGDLGGVEKLALRSAVIRNSVGAAQLGPDVRELGCQKLDMIVCRLHGSRTVAPVCYGLFTSRRSFDLDPRGATPAPLAHTKTRHKLSHTPTVK
jgi:hypothetical protein